MIRLTCSNCQTRLNAKDELAGQTRKCPKCAETIRIPEAPSAADTAAASGDDEWDGLDDVAPDQHVHDALDHELPAIEAPERLTRLNRYLICDKTKLFGMWEGNGQGWMVKTSSGFVKARLNPDKLPSQGDFTLVELRMAMNDDGLRLSGIHCYELAKRWVLTTLEQDDHRILGRINGPGCLTKEQKSVVQAFLREHFMRNVWEEAANVLDYLSNFDYHSPGVG
jgi:hypothetical protein